MLQGARKWSNFSFVWSTYRGKDGWLEAWDILLQHLDGVAAIKADAGTGAHHRDLGSSRTGASTLLISPHEATHRRRRKPLLIQTTYLPILTQGMRALHASEAETESN